MSDTIDCPRCNATGSFTLIGEGFDVSNRCSLCGGTGKTTRENVARWYAQTSSQGHAS